MSKHHQSLGNEDHKWNLESVPLDAYFMRSEKVNLKSTLLSMVGGPHGHLV